MANEDKRIDQLPAVTILSQDSLLVLQQNGQAFCMTVKQLLDYIQNNGNGDYAVKYVSQILSTAQKKQARTNIGAAGAGDIPTGVVLYTSQSLTDPQKQQARLNIGAAAIGDGSGGTLEGAVLYISQSLTEEQQAQARSNIKCGSIGVVNEGCEASHPGTSAGGKYAKAMDVYSHAFGYFVRANAESSSAEGMNTDAYGVASHAEGSGTKVRSEAGHVQGRYNVDDVDAKFAHIVGNGTSGNDRSNAHTLDWEGNAWYAGSVEGTVMILKSPGGKRFQIAVDDSGNLNAAALTE